MKEDVIVVKNLKVHFFLDEGVLKAVDGVNFSLTTNQTVGIIGESGCGKSVTARSLLRIIPDPGRIVEGEILYTNNGQEIDLARISQKDRRLLDIRGGEIAMIFQEPMTSLSPVHSIGSQIMENLLLHTDLSKTEARKRTIDLLNKVGISNAPERVDEYPHQMSGGMRQRVVTAMAIACNPRVLIADEPTTALDVTVQAQILELLKGIQNEFSMAIMYITHDLGVIAEISNRVDVMYLGRIVERGDVYQIFDNPQHPYTQRLMRSIPRVGRRKVDRLDAIAGTVPIPLNTPPMCGFYSRCHKAMKGRCDAAVPAQTEIETGHFLRCFLHSEEAEPVNSPQMVKEA